MVKEANVKQAAAEKQLKEAQGKVSFFPTCLFSLFTWSYSWDVNDGKICVHY